MSVADHVKRADWLELFFDLVFVYAIAKTTHVIAHPHGGHIALADYGLFALILVPVWWAWTGHTLFSTRFGNGDTLHRLLTLGQMLGALFLAVFINPDFGATYVGFLLSYLTIRLLLIVMYLRAGSRQPEVTPVTGRMVSGFGLGLLVVASSFLADPPLRYVVLYAGIFIEVLTPILLRSRLTTMPVNTHHLPERFGLLTIILLGESVVALGAPLSEGALSAIGVLAVIVGFIMLSAAWWLYFDLTDRRLVGHHLGHGQRVVYGHLPLYAGLAVLANFGRFAVDPALRIQDHLIMGALGLTLFLGALWFMHGRALWVSPCARIAIPVLLTGAGAALLLSRMGAGG